MYNVYRESGWSFAAQVQGKMLIPASKTEASAWRVKRV